MVTELPIVLVEIGYIAAAAAITQGARLVASRIARAQTAAGIRKMLREVAAVPRTEEELLAGYRDNAGAMTTVEESPPGVVDRWRAKRAAAYVHELERRAKIDA